MTEDKKLKRKEAREKYLQSEKGKEALLRYYLSRKGKQSRQKRNELSRLFTKYGKFLKDNPNGSLEDFISSLGESNELG